MATEKLLLGPRKIILGPRSNATGPEKYFVDPKNIHFEPQEIIIMLQSNAILRTKMASIFEHGFVEICEIIPALLTKGLLTY